MASHGQELSAEDVERISAYMAAGVTLPEEFDGVVKENVAGKEVYRYQTDEEAKASEEAGNQELEAVERHNKLREEVVAEAVKRGDTVPVAPAPPSVPQKPESNQKQVEQKQG